MLVVMKLSCGGITFAGIGLGGCGRKAGWSGRVPHTRASLEPGASGFSTLVFKSPISGPVTSNRDSGHGGPPAEPPTTVTSGSWRFKFKLRIAVPLFRRAPRSPESRR